MPLTCNKRFSMPIHPSVKVGGFTTGLCERDVLPGMVVCEYHAEPEAVRMLVEGLLKTIEELRPPRPANPHKSTFKAKKPRKVSGR